MANVIRAGAGRGSRGGEDSVLAGGGDARGAEGGCDQKPLRSRANIIPELPIKNLKVNSLSVEAGAATSSIFKK